jgi:hypothetical protein
MARRASSSINPIWLIAAAIAIAGGIGGVLMFKGSVGDPFRTLTPFPVAEYMQNSNSLRGNTYKIECVVGEQLKYTNSERLFSVEVGGEPVGLLVPAELRGVNIQKGQRFLFRVEVGDKGVIRAVEAKKV